MQLQRIAEFVPQMDKDVTGLIEEVVESKDGSEQIALATVLSSHQHGAEIVSKCSVFAEARRRAFLDKTATQDFAYAIQNMKTLDKTAQNGIRPAYSDKECTALNRLNEVLVTKFVKIRTELCAPFNCSKYVSEATTLAKKCARNPQEGTNLLAVILAVWSCCVHHLKRKGMPSMFSSKLIQSKF